MSNDKIEQWIQKKLEKGVEKKRIKKSLENTGHDPSLVEEVQESSDIGDDPFQQNEESSEVQKNESEQDQETRKMELDFDSDDTGESLDNEISDTQGQVSKDSGLDISASSVTSIKGDKKSLKILGASLFVLMAMTGFYSYIEISGVFEPKCSGEEGAGVKVYDVYEEGGETVAMVNTYEEVTVVLEVFDSNGEVGQTVQEYNSPGDRTEIRVGAIGNRISFHEYGCDEPSVERNY